MKIIANFLNKFLDEHAKNEINKRQELLVFCNYQIKDLKIKIDKIEKGKQRDSIYDVLDNLILKYHDSPDRSIRNSKGELVQHGYTKWIYTYFYAIIDNRDINYKYLLKRFICTYRAIIRKVLLLKEEIKYKNIEIEKLKCLLKISHD
jgi:hypothetical protein